MKELVLEKLTIDGFKAFTKPITLKDPGIGLHYIGGRNEIAPRLGANGVGKSSLFDALCYCLYGRTPGGLRGTDVKPWKGSKTPHISAHMRVAGAPTVITRNGTKLSIDARSAAQPQIDAKLGLTFDLFTNTVLLGQGRPLFFDLPPREKLIIVSAALDLTRWDGHSDIALARAAGLDDLVRQAETELSITHGRLSQVEQQHVQTRDLSQSWNMGQEKLYAKAHEDVKKAEKGKEKLAKERAKYDLAHDSAATELRAINRELETMAREQGELEAQLSALRDMQRHLRNENCPTCGQRIPRDSEINPKQVKARMKKLEEKQAERMEVYNRLGARRSEFQRKQDNNWAKLEPLVQGIERFDAIIADARRVIAANTEDPYSRLLRDLRNQINDLRAKVTQLTEKRDKLTRKRDLTKFWVKGFRDVKLFLIDEFLEELKLTTNAYLEEVGLVGWSIDYMVVRESLSTGNEQRGLFVVIHSPDNEMPARFDSWSGGEAQRLRIIGSCALSDTLLNYAGVTPSFEIYDEPSSHLSREGVADLCQFLADRANALRRTIFYVDHAAPRSSMFASETILERRKDGIFLT